MKEKLNNLFKRLRSWTDANFSGIVTITFYQGGIRKVRVEYEDDLK